MQNENYFSTRDLYLASVLLTLKFNLTSIDRQVEGLRSHPVGYFNFTQTPELTESERKYWARRLAVEPIEFIDNLYQLKSEVTGTFNKRARIDASPRDIHFAATLLTLRFNLINIEYKEEGWRQQLVGYFIFEDNIQSYPTSLSPLEKAKDEYLNGLLAVEPILFISNLRGLKSQLANIYKSPYTNIGEFKKT